VQSGSKICEAGFKRRTKAGTTTCFYFAGLLCASRDRTCIARAQSRAARTRLLAPKRFPDAVQRETVHRRSGIVPYPDCAKIPVQQRIISCCAAPGMPRRCRNNESPSPPLSRGRIGPHGDRHEQNCRKEDLVAPGICCAVRRRESFAATALLRRVCIMADLPAQAVPAQPALLRRCRRLPRTRARIRSRVASRAMAGAPSHSCRDARQYRRARTRSAAMHAARFLCVTPTP
jgi:hypothetical protein